MKEGDVVRLGESMRSNYSDSAWNPHSLTGIVTECKWWIVTVRWENGYDSWYRLGDLVVVDASETV